MGSPKMRILAIVAGVMLHHQVAVAMPTRSDINVIRDGMCNQFKVAINLPMLVG